MSLAEALGRLGCAVVTWLCIYAWLIWTATLRVADCRPGGDDLWALSLGFGVLTTLLSPAIGLTRPLDELHQVIRRFGWPLVLLVPLALLPIGSAWRTSTFGGAPLCAFVGESPWHAWWAPLQTLLLALAALSICRQIRPCRHPTSV